jgi:hypothetical protein
MAGTVNPVLLDMPGYNPPGPTFNSPDDSVNMGMSTAGAYKIPPAIWPIVFLVVAYLGLRLIME